MFVYVLLAKSLVQHHPDEGSQQKELGVLRTKKKITRSEYTECAGPHVVRYRNEISGGSSPRVPLDKATCWFYKFNTS